MAAVARRVLLGLGLVWLASPGQASWPGTPCLRLRVTHTLLHADIQGTYGVDTRQRCAGTVTPAHMWPPVYALVSAGGGQVAAAADSPPRGRDTLDVRHILRDRRDTYRRNGTEDELFYLYRSGAYWVVGRPACFPVGVVARAPAAGAPLYPDTVQAPWEEDAAGADAWVTSAMTVTCQDPPWYNVFIWVSIGVTGLLISAAGVYATVDQRRRSLRRLLEQEERLVEEDVERPLENELLAGDGPSDFEPPIAYDNLFPQVHPPLYDEDPGAASADSSGVYSTSPPPDYAGNPDRGPPTATGLSPPPDYLGGASGGSPPPRYGDHWQHATLESTALSAGSEDPPPEYVDSHQQQQERDEPRGWWRWWRRSPELLRQPTPPTAPLVEDDDDVYQPRHQYAAADLPAPGVWMI